MKKVKRVCRLTGIVSRPLQTRYLLATEAERETLKPVIQQESRWMVDKMARKGYRLEATVSEVFGLFTRRGAIGTVRLTDASTPVVEETAEASVS